MKKPGSGLGAFDETVSRSEFLRAFGKLAIYAAPAVLVLSQTGCDESTGGGGDGDDDCSMSSSLGSLSSFSCSSSSESSESECAPGTFGCDGVAT